MTDNPLDPREMSPEDFARYGVERISRGDAIRAKCRDCGESPRAILECAVSTCALWPFRMGTDPWREKREMTDEQRAAASERLRLAREARG